MKPCHTTIYETNAPIGEANLRVQGDEPTFTAYGGYHDAGDADRRTYHMDVSATLLTTFEAFPDLFTDDQFNIPDISGPVEELSRSMESEKAKLRKISSGIDRINTELKNTPGAGLRNKFTCDKCGSEGYTVIPVQCSNCGDMRLPHTVCPNCGHYKGREVISVEEQ